MACQKAIAQRFLRLRQENPQKYIEGVDYSGLEEKIKIAAESCPVEVIKYDEDDDLKNAPPPINRSMGDWD